MSETLFLASREGRVYWRRNFREAAGLGFFAHPLPLPGGESLLEEEFSRSYRIWFFCPPLAPPRRGRVSCVAEAGGSRISVGDQVSPLLGGVGGGSSIVFPRIILWCSVINRLNSNCFAAGIAVESPQSGHEQSATACEDLQRIARPECHLHDV